MSISDTAPISNHDTLAYIKMPKSLQGTSLPDSIATALHYAYLETYDPDDAKLITENIKKQTVNPGEQNEKVEEIAIILTRVEKPITGGFFLAPETFAKLPEKNKSTLNGPILEALRSFQHIYMGQAMPTGSLGPFECKRILTIDAGMMLTQVINPVTHRPYLDPKVFNGMPRIMRVKLGKGYTEMDNFNPLFEAFKDFLMNENFQSPDTEETINTIIGKHYLLQRKWEGSKKGTLHR